MSTETISNYKEISSNWATEEIFTCKQIFIKAIFDPVLSGEIFQFIYDYLNHSRRVNMSSFSFNDQNKFLDIVFEFDPTVISGPELYSTKCVTVINLGFADLFKAMVYGNNFNRLMNINLSQALLFKDTVVNKPDMLTTLYNCMCMGYQDNKLLVRITLV